jgi:putative membrane protein
MALGATLGLALGFLPGLHPNTSAALAAALAGPPTAILAAAVAHTVAGMLPTTFLGAPAEDAALAAMPAHRLLAAGQGRLAHRVALAASLAGLILGCAAILPMKWLFSAPLGYASALVAWAPFLVAGVTVLLFWRERTGRRVAAAVLLWCLAGGLSLTAANVPLHAAVGVPATPFMPLLAGLFAGTGLLLAMRGPRHGEPQQPMPRLRRRQRIAWRGALARGLAGSVVATVVPGLTPGTAAAMARAGTGDDDNAGDVREIALVACINTAQTVLTVAWLFIAGQSRTGITQLVAAQPFLRWDRGTPPHGLVLGLMAMVVGGLLGAGAARALEPIGLRVAVLDARVVSGGSFMLLTAAVFVLSGGAGLVVFAAALGLGLLGNELGVGRLHLIGCLTLPFLVRAWT